ncbi:F-box only protein 47-like, partial [Limulus polyphemus]|uniref:F-box only protein 47-like n=1 Tax=Limulus polyphemus TaxID=6850 RepID=A0ABM1TR62_LIMPO
IITLGIIGKVFISGFTVEDLSLLTICSKSIRNVVQNYLDDLHGVRRLMQSRCLNIFDPTSSIVQENRHFETIVLIRNVQSIMIEDDITFLVASTYKRYVKCVKIKDGLLMKRSTCLYPTKERLRIVIEFIQSLEQLAVNSKFQGSWLRCCGRLIHTVIAGWDESECHVVYSFLQSFRQMTKHVQSVLRASPGSVPVEEQFIRQYYRSIYLDFSLTPRDKAFWLTRILKPWPLVHQAKLLCLLYGPARNDKLQWWELSDYLPANQNEAKVNLLELAQAIKLLQRYSKDWSDDDIISILEELAEIPEEWLFENVATLYLLCGEPVTVMMMGNKLLNGKITELTNLVAHLALVCCCFTGYFLILVSVSPE